MRRRKKDVNLGLYQPPSNGADYSDGTQVNDGIEKTKENLSAQDSVQEMKRKNKKKSAVNLGIY